MSLLRAREALLTEYRPIFRANNLTEQQWRVLRLLEAASPQDATTVSEETVIRLPSLSRILRDLEGRGLLRRKATKNGPSRLELSITPAGRALIIAVAPEIRARMDHVRTVLKAGEYDHLLAMLDLIASRAPR